MATTESAKTPTAERVGPNSIISEAKIFKEINLQNAGVKKSRVAYGSAFNNMNIVDIQKRIFDSVQK